jgi:putative DNA methylase
MNEPYPRRIIEVDLPIKAISAHARREKSIRHGHISTLHIWWARRPLAACRAVICAALWPDPADDHCPQFFRDAVAQALRSFVDTMHKDKQVAGLSPTLWGDWSVKIVRYTAPDDPESWEAMRSALLCFIADFANWDAATVPAFLETARPLTQAAHLSLTEPQGAGLQGADPASFPQSRPLVVDPFAGGGAIPLEALRVGADAFASDLNPVAVLLNKVVLEYIPRYAHTECTVVDESGQERVLHGLAEAVRYWGTWIKQQAEKELAAFYPKDPDGATPIAYLWARTITCEGPGCGAEVPLMRSLWLAKKGKKSVALRIVPRLDERRVAFEIIENAKAKDVGEGTVRRGSATCPCCGYTTPVASVRQQLKARRGGAADARLFCVVTTKQGQQGRLLPPANRTRPGSSPASRRRTGKTTAE